MENIVLRDCGEVEIEPIMELYKSVNWTNYTSNPSMLEGAIKNSLKSIGAFDEGKLVGIIRVVGDGHSIIYIQDIIVAPEYQRQGIGRRLVEEIDAIFPKVYQKILLTDNSPESEKFYESCGFSRSDKFNCIAFAKINR